MSRSPAGGGIQCPDCGQRRRQVLESRRCRDAVHRRCLCRHCGQRYSTRETIDHPTLGSHTLAFAGLLEQLVAAEEQLQRLRRAIEEQLPND